MRVSMIVAMTRDRVIGRQGGLPWRIPGDLRHFKSLTMGKPVIMGRRTHESIGIVLPGRPNIVITRDPGYASRGVNVVEGLDAALALARNFAEEGDANEVMVIGGAQIYRMALPVAERLYVTEVHAEVAGDTYFPDTPADAWREVSRQDHQADDAGAPAYSFIVLERAP
ncbi:MAG: dihydrofolate reductase [Rhodospirillales bacterium]|nr:dihydrofolate reductase [Rhodospirillales bacterium]MDP6772935.1 dihydrofolate reductase [Rhodospirillales bacterium]